MRTPLDYNGRPMSWAPVNTDVDSIIRDLDNDEPTVIALEPGDATRYNLMLVPLTGDGVRTELRWAGVPPDAADRFLLVVKLAGDPRHDGWAWVPWEPGVEIGPHDVASLNDNGWSQTLLAWWLTGLRHRIDYHA